MLESIIIMHTEFNYKKVLEEYIYTHKYIPIEPKSGDCYAYLSAILLDSILVDLNNKHHSQILLRKCMYVADKKVLLGKYIDKYN